VDERRTEFRRRTDKPQDSFPFHSLGFRRINLCRRLAELPISSHRVCSGARLSPRRDLPAPEPRPPLEFHPTNVPPPHRQSQSTPEGSHTQGPLTPEEAALSGFRGGGTLTAQSRMSGGGGWPYRLVFTTQFPLLPIALSPHVGALQRSV